MIITNQNSIDPQQPETQQQKQEKKDVQRSSDRFANMLDGHRKEQSQFDKASANAAKEQAAKRQEKSLATSSAAKGDPASGNDPSNAKQVETDRANEAAPVMHPDIQKLADEFGHQIDLHRLGNQSHVVDITFHSKTLPGLKVQVRQTKGELSIRFLSQSVSTTQLLAKHTASLQESLENKGLKIASITLAGSRYPTDLGSRNVST